MAAAKPEIITFKAEPDLSESLRQLPNRSAFIRAAILAALENACPLCQGTGMLTVDQRRHWDRFAADHPMQACDDCHTSHPVCECNGIHEG
jgi:hypothetical protein